MPKVGLLRSGILKIPDQKVLDYSEGEYKRICALEKYREAHPLESAYEQYSPARKALVRPIVLSDEEYITRWKSRQHTVLGFEEGAPEFYTKAGLRVRSFVGAFGQNGRSRISGQQHFEAQIL